MGLRILYLFLFFFFNSSDILSQDSLRISTAVSFFNQAWTIYATQEKEAIVLLKKAADIYKEEKEAEKYIETQNGISFLLYSQFKKNGNGDPFFNNAQATVLEAEKKLNTNSKNYAAALNNLGLAYKDYKRNYELALDYYNHGLKIMQEAGEKVKNIATSYFNIGNLYRAVGDYDEGIQYFRKAEKLFSQEANKNKGKIANTYLTIGHLYRDKKDNSNALESYYEYLKKTEATSSAQKKSLGNLIYCYHSISRIYSEQAQYDSAYLYLQKGFDLHQQGIKNREMQSNENLGYYYKLQSNFEKALEAYKRANTLADERYKAVKHPAKSRTLSQIADSYLGLKDFHSALQYYQKAIIALAFDLEELPIDKNPSLKQFLSLPQALDIITAKANTFHQRFLDTQNQEDLLLARQNYQFATELINEQRRNFLADGSKHTLAAKALSVYEGAIEVALQLHQLTNETTYLEEAFSFAERNKSLLLLESMQENVAKIAGQLSEDDLRQEKELNSEIAFFEKQLISEKGKGEKRNAEKIKQWENDLFDTKQQYQKLVASFEKKYPDYYQLKHRIEPSSVPQLRQQLLDAKTALFEYFVGNDHIYAFCITAQELKVEKIDRSEALSNSLNQLTALISQPPFKQDATQLFANFSQSNWELSQQLLLPLIASLPQQVKHLIIIPDDQLAYLPFELLLTQKPAEGISSFSPKQYDYLIKKYAISYNYSATLLLNHLKRKSTKHLKPIIGFAPSFASGPIAAARECFDGEVYSLQCNGEEVKAINGLFNGQEQIGGQANLASFKEMAKDYRIIHLATHACAGESDALNKIYFADGYLTNFDLNNLELNADLAVLSACNTGSGQLVKGEGVMSLSRGFTLANCPSTLMSLWTVDDCITSDLMLRFYEKLKTGLPKDKALQLTKIEHLESADKAGLHPYYWAAFLQSGNASAMDFSTGWNYWWGLPAMVLFMLLLFLRRRRRGRRRARA